MKTEYTPEIVLANLASYVLKFDDAHDEGWTRIIPPAPLMASRIASYHNANT